MQVFIVLGWLLSLAWVTILPGLLALLIVLAVGGYFVVRAQGLGSLVMARAAIDPGYVAALETLVAEAEAEVETTERDCPASGSYGRFGAGPKGGSL